MRRRLETARKYFRLRGGTYVYVGELMVSPLPEPARRAAGRRLVLLSAAVGACVLAAGCLPVPGMRQGPAVIPFYLVEVCAAARLVWAAFCLTREDWRAIRAYRFAGTAAAIPPAAGFVIVFAAAAAAGSAPHLFSGDPFWTVLFLLSQAAAAGLSLPLRRIARSLPWERVPPSPADTAEDAS